MSISGRKTPWVHIACISLIIATIVFISLLASVPPVDRDALTHHLAVPKLYLQHGGIYEIPHLYFSYFPMNVTLLYTIPLYFGNDILPKFIHFAFALGTAALIYRYLIRRINKTHALLGALFFLTIPVIIRLSSTVYVDLGLIFFSFASLLYVLHWVESDFSPRYLVIAAVFCGLALGTKYNGLVSFFLLAMIVAFVYARYHAGHKQAQAKAVGWCALFIVVAMLVFSPWMARNVALTGNPVYPLYKGVFEKLTTFGNGQIESTEKKAGAEEAPRPSHIDIRRHIYGETWVEIALIPVRVFFQGEDDNPQYFDGRTNPFLLILPLFAFFAIRAGPRQERTEKYAMLFFSVFFLLYACAQTSIRIRYFSPIIPPLVVLSMYGLYNLQTLVLARTDKIPGFVKNFVIFGVVFVMLGLNAVYMMERFEKDQPLAYIGGQLSRDEYIQAYRPEYESFQYANRRLSKDDRILGLYIDRRGYYSDIPIVFSNDLFEFAENTPTSGADVAKSLHESGVTHMLVSFIMLDRQMKRYDMPKRQVLSDFFGNHAVVKFSKDGYGLVRLVNVNF